MTAFSKEFIRKADEEAERIIREYEEGERRYQETARRRQNLSSNDVLSVGYCLGRYLGEHKNWLGNSPYCYEMRKDNEKLKVTYRNFPEVGYNLFIQLFQRNRQEWIEVSTRTFGSPVAYLSEAGNPDNMEGRLIDVFILKNFNEIKDRICKNADYVYNTFLIPKYFDRLKEVGKLDPSTIPLTAGEVKELDRRLGVIYSSDKLLGIKNDLARKLIQKLEKRGSARQKCKRGMTTSDLGSIGHSRLSEKDAEESDSIAGFRKDLPHGTRSIWEANYARALIYDGIDYRYEPESFELDVSGESRNLFKKDKITYVPDFMIRDTNHFVEVKGFENAISTAKIALLRSQFPEIDVRVVGRAEYDELTKQYEDTINNDTRFCGWENGNRTTGNNLFTNTEKFRKIQEEKGKGRCLDE